MCPTLGVVQQLVVGAFSCLFVLLMLTAIRAPTECDRGDCSDFGIWLFEARDYLFAAVVLTFAAFVVGIVVRWRRDRA
jgi:hypothetical protein